MIETLRREATGIAVTRPTPKDADVAGTEVTMKIEQLDNSEARDFAFVADILDNWNANEEKNKELWFRMERTVSSLASYSVLRGDPLVTSNLVPPPHRGRNFAFDTTASSNFSSHPKQTRPAPGARASAALSKMVLTACFPCRLVIQGDFGESPSRVVL